MKSKLEECKESFFVTVADGDDLDVIMARGEANKNRQEERQLSEQN